MISGPRHLPGPEYTKSKYKSIWFYPLELTLCLTFGLECFVGLEETEPSPPLPSSGGPSSGPPPSGGPSLPSSGGPPPPSSGGPSSPPPKLLPPPLLLYSSYSLLVPVQ